MNIIKVVETEARAIAATLDFEDGHHPTDDTLRTLLDTAAKAVDSGGEIAWSSQEPSKGCC